MPLTRTPSPVKPDPPALDLGVAVDRDAAPAGDELVPLAAWLRSVVHERRRRRAAAAAGATNNGVVR